MKTGKLYWITGLSGAGKTSLAECFYHRMQQHSPSIVYLDGDELRAIYQEPGHYDFVGRKSVSMKHARLCALLTEQNHDVICATISMFDEVREWLKDHIEQYIEILITAPSDVLEQRRQLTFLSNDSENCSIVGEDIVAEFPQSPHVTLVNDGSMTVTELCNQLEFALKSIDSNQLSINKL
ncbi:MAG: adenylyl-sulfate kinase [Marinicella sp.]